MSVKFNNYSRSIGRQGTNEYFKWRVFVDEPQEKLDQIQEVEYFLHPTFPEPYRVRRNRDEKFALDSTGWGEFAINITVQFKDGRSERVKYWLMLDPEKKPWPTEQVA